MEISVSAENSKVRKHIPDDISFFILSKLSIKSLKRFQCVRKSWSLLFENTLFMNMFRNNFILNCSNYDQASLILHESDFNLYSLSGERLENIVKLDWSNLVENRRGLSIFGFGSINGIFCIQKYYKSCKLLLWNPAAQVIKFIPPSPVESIGSSLPYGSQYIEDVTINLHGFGYDHVINDYKVIRYVYFMGEHINLDRLGDESLNPLWEIYSLKSNSWRKIDVVDMPYSLECAKGTQVYTDGVCHWLCEENDVAEQCLVSFDLSKEVFFTTPTPSYIDEYDISALWIDLKVLNGSIAFISYDDDKDIFHISILGEIGVKESWTKLFIVGPLPCFQWFIGVGMKGEIFFTRKDEKELAWFDLSTQMIEKLDLKGQGTNQILIYQ